MSQQPSKKKVLVFTTSSCRYCIAVKNFLKQHKIRFREINIERDQRAAHDVQRMTGGMGVPVVKIGSSKPIVGFDRLKISRELGIR